MKQKTTIEDIFLNIFFEIDFPFLALDLFELSEAIKKREYPHSYIGVPLLKETNKKDALRGSLRGIFRRIEPPEQIFSILNNSKIISSALDTKKGIREQIESANNLFGIYETDRLVWEEDSYWPLAYNSLIGQLANIIQLFTVALSERKSEFSKIKKIGVSITSEYPRNMPTVIHYATAALGAWMGGSDNFQFISYFASKPQINESNINISYAKLIGYNENDGVELDKSGIIAIPAPLFTSLLEAQGTSNLFGTLPIDEFNVVNLPEDDVVFKNNEAHLKENKLYGLILDKYYRTPFLARKLENTALYGKKNILRDHFTDFYNSLENYDLIRCKHYCVPVIDVTSYDEMISLTSRIPKRGSGEMFFRGQTKYYNLNRTNRVKNLLFGKSNSNEPSLITSAIRTKFNYDALHFALKYYFGQERLYSQNYSREYFIEKNNLWREMSLDPCCQYDYAIMALAQHYGLPSHGLDVTTSLDVALWFATNQFEIDNNGISSYHKINKEFWGNDKKGWPIIFVFQPVLKTIIPSLQDCQELNKLNVTALRPERQSAKFFLGGHSDHQNRLAEAIVCAFRLSPSEYNTTLDFDYLFPTPEEDQAYFEMLKLSKDETFKYLTNGKINKFHK